MADIVAAFGEGLWVVLSLNTFALLLIGTTIGFFVGLLPGIGGPAALALMLPFTFTMQPAGAFAFLLGMLTVTGTTGDITSILFGIPGEPHTAATIVDGHPMAKNGEAGRAIGAACMSSLLGAWIGAFGLALAIPVFRPLVLLIGYGEFFMLTLLGVTMVASLTGKSFLRGMIAAGTGFLLSMIGLDPIAGTQRYTFGQIALWDGLGLVVITLGIFAIPELIDLAIKGTSIDASGTRVSKVSGVMEGMKDAFRHLGLTLRCSVLGMLLGLIPGMGATITQWLAYAHAVQSRPNKAEQFGNGAVEGVLAPAAANHSTLGGHLITTVAFGIPGGVVMAILLGAFIIQGIVPGPSMLIPERNGGHLTLTFSFVWTIVIANVIAVLVSLVFLKQIIKVTHLRANILIPFVLLLIFLGALAESNTLPSLVILLLLGVLGWVMTLLDWPRPPFILGVVLAPLVENNLFLAISADGAAWLWRPGVLLLFVIGAAVVLFPFFRRVPSSKSSLRSQEASQDEVPGSHIGNIAFGVFLVALFSFAIWASWDWPWRSRLFPWVAGWPTLTFAAVQLVIDVQKWRKQNNNKQKPSGGTELVRGRTIQIWGSIVGFFISIWLFGFFIAVPLNILFYLRFVGREKWFISIALAILAWMFFNGLFSCLLQLPFPQGVLIRLLDEIFGIDLTKFIHSALRC